MKADLEKDLQESTRRAERVGARLSGEGRERRGRHRNNSRSPGVGLPRGAAEAQESEAGGSPARVSSASWFIHHVNVYFSIFFSCLCTSSVCAFMLHTIYVCREVFRSLGGKGSGYHNGWPAARAEADRSEGQKSVSLTPSELSALFAASATVRAADRLTAGCTRRLSSMFLLLT